MTEEEKKKIISDYMRQLAYKSVEAQKNNKEKFIKMGQKSGISKRKKIRDRARKIDKKQGDLIGAVLK